MRFALVLFARQAVLFLMAALAYFGVRGLTEGSVGGAQRNASRVLDVERFVGIDVELGLQKAIDGRQVVIDLANWIYIWAHWPVVAATLIWLVFRHRHHFFELRNAMFISGAIGLVIFAMFPVSPPRLFGPEYVDTVTQHSEAYRVLQPPGLVNKYAAVPSLHFGWNLLVGLVWFRVWRAPAARLIALAMPAAMAFAVVATANHWTLDVMAGGIVALCGLGLERLRQGYVARRELGPDDDGNIGDAEVIDIRERSRTRALAGRGAGSADGLAEHKVGGS